MKVPFHLLPFFFLFSLYRSVEYIFHSVKYVSHTVVFVFHTVGQRIHL
jgi:hypothetical protein